MQPENRSAASGSMLLRELADAVDKDRGHDKSLLTTTMREVADECDRHSEALADERRVIADYSDGRVVSLVALGKIGLRLQRERRAGNKLSQAATESPFPHPEFGQESDRTVPAALQEAVNEVEALRLMSYTGGQPDLREEDVRGIRDLIIDLALLLSDRTGEPLPTAEDIL